jgi:hypothetical protein
MTDKEKLALAQRALAAITQGLVGLHWLQQESDMIAIPTIWVRHWITQSREALCLLRKEEHFRVK